MSRPPTLAEAKTLLTEVKYEFDSMERGYERHAAAVRGVDILKLIEKAGSAGHHDEIRKMINLRAEGERLLTDRLMMLLELGNQIRILETNILIKEGIERGLKRGA